MAWRRRATVTISRMTAPLVEVMTPMHLGKVGQGALAGGVEEAFGFEAVAEAFEGELEGSGAAKFEGFGDELELATGLVDADAAAGSDLVAVFGAEAEELGLAAEEDDGKLGFARP